MTDFNLKNDTSYQLLMSRRSVKAKDMAGPGPGRDDIEKILSAATRVPDHGKLTPWRFIVLTGAEREKLGDLIAAALVSEEVSDPRTAEKMRGYATQGPVLIIAVYSPSDDRPIPRWEQQLSVGAACQNMLTAATALGYASQWLTGWASYSPAVAAGVGLKGEERIAGLIFLGDHGEAALSERARPLLTDVVSWGMPDAN